ncbi:MAG: hypothetical protein ABIQ95_09020 [Bdellovibrionia bacterium]
MAAEHGHADIAAKLTMAGIDPEDRPRGSGHTALSLATAMGHSKVVSAIKKASQTLHDSQECRNENHP